MERSFGPYPGLAVLGGGGLAGLYGPAASPPKSWGAGLQHLFYGDYQQDLIHTATTLLRLPDGRVEWGNRTYDYRRHPERLRPLRLFNQDGYRFGSAFRCRGPVPLVRTEVVQAVGDGVLRFAVTLENPGAHAVTVTVYALVIFQGDPRGHAAMGGPEMAHWQGSHPQKHLAVAFPGADRGGLVVDSPSGFLYRTIQAAHGEAGTPLSGEVADPQPIGLLLGQEVTVPAGGSLSLTWLLGAGRTPAEAAARVTEPHDGAAYWERWFSQGAAMPLSDPLWAHYYRTNLAALRAAVMPDGFIPADMSGQYFADGAPSYYARDALMVARAFLLAGQPTEFAAILRYLAGRETKGAGEFYQRYDAAGLPAEGQNNGVPHQLDSQGYFSRLVHRYWRLTGALPVTFEQLAACLDVLPACVGPQGMVGPEGGVNEGVFGPAYITSTNMCIHGGLSGAIEIAAALGEEARAEDWRRLREQIAAGIAAAWDPVAGRYAYGFTVYAAEPVRKYDTPQYFGPLYGYPIDQRYRQNDRALRRHARFMGAGVGYSEQEYHHGPWTFNTAACAEVQALLGNWREYERIVRWLIAHANQFGQMPESFMAEEPRRCQVNPLVWGCAEAAAALAILGTADGERPGRLPGAERYFQD